MAVNTRQTRTGREFEKVREFANSMQSSSLQTAPMNSYPVSALLVRFLLSASQMASPLLAASEHKDIPYLDSGNPAHRLDLYHPDAPTPAPLIVWIHGGAWRSGSKDSVGIIALVEKGWAIASVEYRLSGEAPFPAAVHDIKAAIRFLRAQAEDFGLDPDAFAISGDSAGGHLAALVGLSNGDRYLEGELGEHLQSSSAIQAVVSLFGASNLTTILDQSTPHGLSVRQPAMELLLGGPISERRQSALLASPVHYVNERSVPVLLIHGDQDPQMPINQSHELQGLCEANGVPVEFEVIHGAKHGGPRFYDATRLALIDRFLRQHLTTTTSRK